MPDQREAKPLFSDIPLLFLKQCSAYLGSGIVAASVAYGGLSASATFIFQLQDGRKVFAKGNHPMEMSHGAETLRQEVHVYKSVPQLIDLSPPFLGMLAAGDDHLWSLGFWRAVDSVPFVLAADECVSVIRSIQCLPEQSLRSYADNNYLSQIFNPDKKWRRIMGDDAVRRQWGKLFLDAGQIQDWTQKNLPVLIDWQSRSLEHAPKSFMHGDLRLDNIIADKARKYVIDWANASTGPAVFDPVFFFTHMDGLGLHDFDDLWELGKASGLLAIPDDDKIAMMVKLSGYFATQAYRPVPEKMPRLRWMQKTMLFSLLNRLSRYGLIERLPQIADLNPEFRFEC
jgi:hypothetical protein